MDLGPPIQEQPLVVLEEKSKVPVFLSLHFDTWCLESRLLFTH